MVLQNGEIQSGNISGNKAYNGNSCKPLEGFGQFYIYAEVKLLTSQVDVLGVYLYDMAFSTHNFGKAAAISLVLFVFIFAMVMLIRKVVFKNDED